MTAPIIMTTENVTGSIDQAGRWSKAQVPQTDRMFLIENRKTNISIADCENSLASAKEQLWVRFRVRITSTDAIKRREKRLSHLSSSSLKRMAMFLFRRKRERRKRRVIPTSMVSNAPTSAESCVVTTNL